MNNLSILEEMIFANIYSQKYFDLIMCYGEEKSAGIATEFAIAAVLAFRKLDINHINKKLEQYHIEG